MMTRKNGLKSTAVVKEVAKTQVVTIEIPVSDELTGGYLDDLPRFISGVGLGRNTLAKEGLRRLHRAINKRQRLSTGKVVDGRSDAMQWLLERVADTDT